MKNTLKGILGLSGKVAATWLLVYITCFATNVSRTTANGVGIAATILIILTAIKNFRSIK